MPVAASVALSGIRGQVPLATERDKLVPFGGPKAHPIPAWASTPGTSGHEEASRANGPTHMDGRNAWCGYGAGFQPAIVHRGDGPLGRWPRCSTHLMVGLGDLGTLEHHGRWRLWIAHR